MGARKIAVPKYVKLGNSTQKRQREVRKLINRIVDELFSRRDGKHIHKEHSSTKAVSRLLHKGK